MRRIDFDDPQFVTRIAEYSAQQADDERLNDWKPRHHLREIRRGLCRLGADSESVVPVFTIDDALNWNAAQRRHPRQALLLQNATIQDNKYEMHERACRKHDEGEEPEALIPRSEERRVGKEWASTCRTRWFRD